MHALGKGHDIAAIGPSRGFNIKTVLVVIILVKATVSCFCSCFAAIDHHSIFDRTNILVLFAFMVLLFDNSHVDHYLLHTAVFILSAPMQVVSLLPH